MCMCYPSNRLPPERWHRGVGLTGLLTQRRQRAHSPPCTLSCVYSQTGVIDPPRLIRIPSSAPLCDAPCDFHRDLRSVEALRTIWGCTTSCTLSVKARKSWAVSRAAAGIFLPRGGKMRPGARDGDHVAFSISCSTAKLALSKLLNYDFTEETGGIEKGLRLV